MSAQTRRMPVSSGKLRAKFIVAFCLMSLIPLLILAYIICNYIFPVLDPLAEISMYSPESLMYTLSLIMLLALLTSSLGFYIAKGTIDRVIHAALETRLIASGKYDRKIFGGSDDDEIGDIARSVNKMASLIRSDLEEFKTYSQRTQEINVAIRKNLLALSGLLQVADVISSSSMGSSDVMDMILERVCQLVDSSYAALYFKEAAGDLYRPVQTFGVEGERVKDMPIRMNEGLFGRSLFSRSIIVIDSVERPKEADELQRSYGIMNVVSVPIYSRKRPVGVLLVGTRTKEFEYQKDEVEFYKVFAKQIAIVIENDLLLKRVRELALLDDLTGLYTENYIKGVLDDEIKRSMFFQRPCSLDMFMVDDFKRFREKFGDLRAEEVLKKIAGMVKKKAGPVGKAARIGGEGFALLLPEKNKREATRIADELRREVEEAGFSNDASVKLTISGGIGENPLDGATADEIYGKAADALEKAMAGGKNRIVA
ncbi:MAG: diguanylate cyclase [Candidatus Omnitrophota bacterium]